MGRARLVPLAVAAALAVPGAAVGADGLGAGAAPASAPGAAPAATLPTALRVPGALSARVASYHIAAELDVERHLIHARERLTWRNSRTVPATELKLHLYMNAFKNEQSVFMREAAGGGGRFVVVPKRWGYVEVRSIRLGAVELRGRAVVARCPEGEAPGPDCPRDETVMDLPLPTPVAPGATVVLDLVFEVQLPEIVIRTGYRGTFHMVGQWFPKVGVFAPAPGGARWQCHPFHANSEFFADFGEYVVELTVPDGWVVGATGVLAGERPAGPGRRTLIYHAEDVHDFAWAADPDFREARDSFEDVEIRLLYHPGSERGVARQLAVAKATLAFLSRRFFPYPYRQLTIVEPTFRGINAGGMEYPTLVTSFPGAAAVLGSREIEEVTAHEITHNWFQGMIASNEPEEAWLDEGVTTYVTGLVLEEHLGSATALDLLGVQVAEVDLKRLSYTRRPSVVPLETAAWRFPPRGYGAVYFKTAMALRTLEGYLGRERLLGGLRAYARAQRFRHPRAEDFFAAVSQGVGEDLGWFFRPVFLGTATLDYEVTHLDSRRRLPPEGIFDADGGRPEVGDPAPGPPRYDTTVVVERRGEPPLPVDVEVTYRSGAKERVRWDARERWRRFDFVRGEPAVAATVDPEHRVFLDVDWLDNGLQRRTRTAPARRLRLGLVFWLQSLMQLLGA